MHTSAAFRTDLTHDLHALACRAAGLAFVNGVTDGWGVGDLARWLSGTYHSVARRRDASGLRARLDLLHIDAIIRDARWRVIAELEAAAAPNARPQLAVRARALGHIEHGIRAGVAGWMPIDLPGMRLRDRVLSLFAVDLLTHPRDFQRSLAICHACDRVMFDAAARERGRCRAHASSESR